MRQLIGYTLFVLGVLALIGGITMSVSTGLSPAAVIGILSAVIFLAVGFQLQRIR
jgi:hypothetical protein